MSKSSMEYYFEFPASRGLQGNTLILLMNVPGRTLSRVLASDNYGHTLERSQREINKSRVKKFYDYLVTAAENKEPFIIPPLVGNCASHVEFEEFGNTNVGVVRFPMDAEIKLFDGQHRAAGISQFCRDNNAILHVPLMMTLQLPLKTRQQFFSDINNNVSKPSAAINMAYNGRDQIAQTMVSFLSTPLTQCSPRSPTLNTAWFRQKVTSGLVLRPLVMQLQNSRVTGMMLLRLEIYTTFGKRG